jgi:type I restriction enzyme S subunit
MYGQGATRGKVAILGIDAACNQACAAIRASDAVVDSKYLYHFLGYRYEAIRHLAHGGQQQNLNLDIVRNLLVAFSCDLKEQREIVVVLDAIDDKIELSRRKRAVLAGLFAALMHSLMTGEIRVTDLDLSALDPKDEGEVAA